MSWQNLMTSDVWVYHWAFLIELGLFPSSLDIHLMMSFEYQLTVFFLNWKSQEKTPATESNHLLLLWSIKCSKLILVIVAHSITCRDIAIMYSLSLLNKFLCLSKIWQSLAKPPLFLLCGFISTCIWKHSISINDF